MSWSESPECLFRAVLLMGYRNMGICVNATIQRSDHSPHTSLLQIVITLPVVMKACCPSKI